MNPDGIELYKDIVKIGIQALAGLIAGLKPFFLERNMLHQRYPNNLIWGWDIVRMESRNS